MFVVVIIIINIIIVIIIIIIIVVIIIIIIIIISPRRFLDCLPCTINGTLKWLTTLLIIRSVVCECVVSHGVCVRVRVFVRARVSAEIILVVTV